MEHELMFGSKPATTPNKRRLQPGGTPNAKTPSKLRKVRDVYNFEALYNESAERTYD